MLTSRLLFLLLALPAAAPEGEPPTALERLTASYNQQQRELDVRHLADLAALAEKASGAEAAAAYERLFRLALDRGLGAEAKPDADRCLASTHTTRDLRALAVLVRIDAAASRGDDKTMLAEARSFLKDRARGQTTAEVESALAVGECCLGRLIAAGRYDAARQLCSAACDIQDAPDAIEDHFAMRLKRIDLLGKSAPEIAGTDVDGTKVALSGLKGKVVLINFWATWCPPCVAAVPHLRALAERYRDQDFAILGVNVDAAHEQVKDAKTALPHVLRFLVEHSVDWTNLLVGASADGPAKAYGVEDIPATFLVGRDGKIVSFDLAGDALVQAIARALDDKR
jgi:thiol-disulfide isomerase/thioredoxin